MLRISVHSRIGNFALIALGAVYALTGLALFVRFVIEARDAAALLDRLMQLSLLVAVIAGVWFVFNALANLGVHRRNGWHLHGHGR